MMKYEIKNPYEACSSQKINDSQSENGSEIEERNFDLPAPKKLFEHEK